MKALLSFAVVSLSLLALSGCKSTEEKSAYVAPARVQGEGPTIVRDEEYIALVERIARRRGVYLQWVNPPSKHIDEQ